MNHSRWSIGTTVIARGFSLKWGGYPLPKTALWPLNIVCHIHFNIIFNFEVVFKTSIHYQVLPPVLYLADTKHIESFILAYIAQNLILY